MRRILLIEDEREARYAIKRVLEGAGYSVVGVEDPREVKDFTGFDLVLLDLKLKDTSGIDVLREMREKGINLPVVVITAYANAENFISAFRYGAMEILKKPFDKKELLEVIESALAEIEPKEPEGLGGVIVGESKSMLEVFKKVGLAASTDMNVLLVGETGVGKDLLAKTIHESSRRREKPFVAINCSAIPENLLEAEFFGYRKGAFTGALRDSKGKVELADGGTLFLDEIGDMPFSLQAKLLRFLEDRTFYRLGDERELRADVRVIAATNRDIKRLIEEGKFREDLYYRLSQIVIEIPPLRDRKEDIPKLVEFFIKKANLEFGTRVTGVEEGVMEKVLSYEWKGNVRELKNAVYMAVLETKKGKIKSIKPLEEEGERDVYELLERCLEKLPESEYPNFLREVEMRFIRFLMDRCGGNKSEVAKLLGISRNTLRLKLASQKQ